MSPFRRRGIVVVVVVVLVVVVVNVNSTVEVRILQNLAGAHGAGEFG